MPKLKTINHQFWIDHELEKVKDEKRRAFLRQQFSGDEGIERFYEMMRSRKGAVEFTNGTWLPKLPKPTPKYLESRKRPCIGCGFRFVELKPWGEVFENRIHIHKSCLKIVAPVQETSNRTTMTATNDTDPLKRIQSARDQIKNEVDALKTHLAKQLQEARTTFGVLTSAEVGVPANELLADSQIAEVLKSFQIISKATAGRSKRKTAGTSRNTGKKKKVRDWICEVLKGGKEMTRPEVEAAIKQASGKKPYNVYKYVGELLKEGALEQPEKGTFKLK